MKAIMYHYVRAYDPHHPHFRFLDIANFRKQLDHFEQTYGFAERDDWNGFVAGHGMGDSAGKVILTFDDAMRCHYDFAFPELRKRGLWGIFFVPTQPYTTGKLLDVHRIHLLCGALDGAQLLQRLLDVISDEMIPDQRRAEFRSGTYVTQDNIEGVSEVKRILNYFIDYRFREGVIDDLARHFDYNFDVDRFYVAPAQLKEMSDAGMVIGSHTVSHPVMSKLPRDAQSTQITDSFAYLDAIGCLDEKTYCHPYGGVHSYDTNTLQLLDEAGVAYSFDVAPRDIAPEDIITSRQCLPRHDCNAFPHGKAS